MHLRRDRGRSSPAIVRDSVGNGPVDACEEPSRFRIRKPTTPAVGSLSVNFSTAVSTSSRNSSSTVTSGFRSSTQSLGSGGGGVCRERGLLNAVGSVTPRFTARANPRLRLNRRTVTPCMCSSLRTTGWNGEWLSTTTISAAPVRTAIEWRSWPISRAVFRHWQKFTMTTLTTGAGGASLRRVCVGTGENAVARVGETASNRSSVSGGVPPGGTARAMPDSFPVAGLAGCGSVREVGRV